MNESLLNSLVRLFALVADVSRDGFSGNEREIVADYLHRQFSNEVVEKYIEYYDKYLVTLHPDIEQENKAEQQRIHNINQSHIIEICENINNELEREQKIIILVYLLDFIYSDKHMSIKELEFVHTIADTLKIAKSDLNNIAAYTFERIVDVKDKQNLLFINNEKHNTNTLIKHFHVDRFVGNLKVLYIPSTNTMVFRYGGGMDLLLNGHNIKPSRSYIWSVGSVVKNSLIGSIYYSKILSLFTQSNVKKRFVFEAHDIEFSYGGGNNGIKPFNFTEDSGRLIGIIGGSGSGKSTLLNVLNGSIKPQKGSVKINGYDVHENRHELRGVIGYVPQDDMLIKELTVYENLYFTAQLSFNNYSPEQIKEVIEQALLDFDLVEARDLKVGSTQRTILSGGQRKRLNIALELLREPSVLFVDEPTSGLSSADTEKVISLLKRQTFKGRLVFAIMHQPSSDIFKLIDKLIVMDQGGRVIYYGNPVEAINYFKHASHFADAEESECMTCGNINTDQILRIVEARIVDVNGRLTRQRKTSPEEWYRMFREKIDKQVKAIKRQHDYTVPKSDFRVPDRLNQMLIYLKRDVLSKLSNGQYMLLNLLVAPALALVLSYFSKHFVSDSNSVSRYIFSENPNIPGYLFMSVIVSLFLGLILSAEEIFKDRKILKRESFIHLSRFSYLNAKVAVLFIISAIQSLLFIVIGNSILEIQGMTFKYWLVLFTCSTWANLVGLNISSGFNSVITIYILIPIILVPQLLFSGTVVDFQNMHKNIKSEKHTPLIGDIMTSRWAYEGLMVTQFKDNAFEKDFFEYDKAINNALFYRAYLLPALVDIAENCTYNIGKKQQITSTINDLSLLRNETQKIKQHLKMTYNEVGSLNIDKYNTKAFEQFNEYINQVDKKLAYDYRRNIKLKENLYHNMVKQYGSENAVYKLKQKHHNKQVAAVVINQPEMLEFRRYKNELIRNKDQVYRISDSNIGRSHFYASFKNIFGKKLPTLYFNLLIIWVFTILFYVMLYYEIVLKIMDYFNHIRLNRLNRQVRKVLKQVTR